MVDVIGEIGLIESLFMNRKKYNVTTKIAKAYVLPILTIDKIGNQAERKHYSKKPL